MSAGVRHCAVIVMEERVGKNATVGNERRKEQGRRDLVEGDVDEAAPTAALGVEQCHLRPYPKPLGARG